MYMKYIKFCGYYNYTKDYEEFQIQYNNIRYLINVYLQFFNY